ncbi:amidase [Rhodococcus sp. ACT016]|uniref:amidase n=1 Tax=Rhodococcus sp. ACT016 TaxID=3134808 RepID=UPI003D2E5B96
MASSNLATLADQVSALQGGTVSSVDLVARAIAYADQCDNAVNAFRSLRGEAALTEAAAADARLAAGDKRPLLGVPVAIKDDMDLAGETTQCGCAGEFTPARRDGEVVRRLREAGAIIIGKTHMPEFGQWPFTEGTFGKTRNPWNPRFTPGGSSGGSAAAVASGVVAAALGSDGAGSVRIPAAWSGLIGIKPQRGRLSTWPYRDAFNGLTVFGPLARTVMDAAILLDAASGNHPLDSVQPSPLMPCATEAAERLDPGHLRVGLSLRPPFVAFPTSLDRQIEAGVTRLAAVIESLGHEVVSLDMPYGLAGAGFLPRSMAGLVDWERRVPDPALLDPRTRANARTGRLLRGLALQAARRQEARVRSRLGKVFENVDVVITPTTAGRAPLVGAFDRLSNSATDRLMTTVAPYAWCWNITGWPGINVPAGIDKDGVPYGAQLLGPDSSEHKLIALAAQLEDVECWHLRQPDRWVGAPATQSPENGELR